MSTSQVSITPAFQHLSVTNDYFEKIGSGKKDFLSIAAKVCILAIPVILLLTLIADLFLAVLNCLFGERQITINPPATSTQSAVQTTGQSTIPATQATSSTPLPGDAVVIDISSSNNTINQISPPNLTFDNAPPVPTVEIHSVEQPIVPTTQAIATSLPGDTVSIDIPSSNNTINQVSPPNLTIDNAPPAPTDEIHSVEQPIVPITQAIAISLPGDTVSIDISSSNNTINQVSPPNLTIDNAPPVPTDEIHSVEQPIVPTTQAIATSLPGDTVSIDISSSNNIINQVSPPNLITDEIQSGTTPNQPVEQATVPATQPSTTPIASDVLNNPDQVVPRILTPQPSSNEDPSTLDVSPPTKIGNISFGDPAVSQESGSNRSSRAPTPVTLPTAVHNSPSASPLSSQETEEANPDLSTTFEDQILESQTVLSSSTTQAKKTTNSIDNGTRQSRANSPTNIQITTSDQSNDTDQIDPSDNESEDPVGEETNIGSQEVSETRHSRVNSALDTHPMDTSSQLPDEDATNNAVDSDRSSNRSTNSDSIRNLTPLPELSASSTPPVAVGTTVRAYKTVYVYKGFDQRVNKDRYYVIEGTKQIYVAKFNVILLPIFAGERLDDDSAVVA